MIATDESPRSPLSEVLDATRHEERRRALRALLMRPILTLGDGMRGDGRDRSTKSKSSYANEESFVLVRRHQAYLSNWFARYTGWTLILRSGSARLVKRTVDIHDATRGAIDPASAGGSLSRSRYVMWCLALSVLHTSGRQTTLQRLADEIIRAAESIPELATAGLQFSLKTATTRRSLVCIVRMLLREGLLSRVEGDESKFGESDTVDCLYDIDPGLLVDVLYLPRSLPGTVLDPSTNHDTRAMTELLTSMLPSERDDDEMRPREIEHRLIGLMLDNPVLYFDQLSEREFAYWQSQRQRLLQVIEDAVGLVAEIRREGVALLDLDGTLTDVKMPDAATVGHATLLIGEFLATQFRGTESDRPTFAISMLMLHLNKLAKEHQTHWRKGLDEASDRQELLSEVLMRLEMLRLIRQSEGDDRIEILPAICRFGLESIKRSKKGKSS
ncbi:TIGR02678 family protein [Neorhodopirellula pilleata]|uniref:TIGR02678 family protein n=1 Tax=Neorhodopirellula pilleata TaxID=2714738 RepID=A0A5C6ACL6_9BACT|nr:TIGR02678 family protein [Neorhodopirellula pilleata]TWT97349.1 hypothetical protein Pla100_25010 [Neorhodopirellula pilleata]